MKYLLYSFLLLSFSHYCFSVRGKAGKAFIQFKSTTILFDTVKAGAPIKGEFTFRNTGDEPLIIITVQASDGGTVADWKTEPIKPGEEGIIAVRLHTQS